MAQKSILILLLHRDGPHSLFKIISCKVKKATLSMSWMHITT